MNEMVDRVARAIESRMRTSPAGQDIGMDIARAAIEAMREPTDAVTAAMVKIDLEMECFASERAVPDIWRAGIDAALK